MCLHDFFLFFFCLVCPILFFSVNYFFFFSVYNLRMIYNSQLQTDNTIEWFEYRDELVFTNVNFLFYPSYFVHCFYIYSIYLFFSKFFYTFIFLFSLLTISCGCNARCGLSRWMHYQFKMNKYIDDNLELKIFFFLLCNFIFNSYFIFNYSQI